MTNDAIFLTFSANKLTQLADRVAACLDSLTHDQVWARSSDNENAIANLVLHLCGNVRQWIGSGVAGREDARHRDEEFAARGDISVADLRSALLRTVAEADQTIRGLGSARLAERIAVQAYNVSVLEAIYHVVEHFSQHTGQIIFATKLFTSSDLNFYKHLKELTHQERVP